MIQTTGAAEPSPCPWDWGLGGAVTMAAWPASDVRVCTKGMHNRCGEN